MSALDQVNDFGKVASVGDMVSCFFSLVTLWAGRIWDCRGAQASPLSGQRPQAVRPELSRRAPLERL